MRAVERSRTKLAKVNTNTTSRTIRVAMSPRKVPLESKLGGGGGGGLTYWLGAAAPAASGVEADERTPRIRKPTIKPAKRNGATLDKMGRAIS